MSTALERLNNKVNISESRLTRAEKRKAKKEARKKGSYKERNGTTRVGDFLRGLKDVAPEIVDLAGKVTGVGGLEILAEKLRGEPSLTDFQREVALKELELDMIEMQALTERLKSDNEHAITRLVRPVSYGFILLNLAFLMYFDGNIGNFTLDPEWKPVIKHLASVMTMFYFGSRGIEKIAKVINK